MIGLTFLALLSWISAPVGWLPAILLGLAAAGQLARLARWRGWRAVADPLVIILHVGYAWLPVGLALLAANQFGLPVPQSAAVHAFTAGAMATMILAVMTRASLGHTGRELRAGLANSVIYLLVTAGALLRVGSSLGVVDYQAGLEIAAAAWAGGFLLFLFVYAPILFGRPIDKKI